MLYWGDFTLVREMCLFFRPAHRIAGLALACLALSSCAGNGPQVSWVAPAPITYGTALSAAQLNATASVPGAFAYTPALGTMLPAGSHTLSVTFTPTDSTDSAAITTSVTLIVNQLPTALSWATPAAISYGTALSAAQLNATASIPGVFAYNPSLGAILSAGSPTLSVTFTPTDSNYAIATASVTLIVNQLPTALSWATPAAISYGTALSAAQLNATVSIPGVFAYNPSLGAILSAGSPTLSVTFTPTDSNYAIATASVTLSISQATPRISWATSAPITYGTALSAAQLNATASVPGAFTYSPSVGTVLSAGSTTLSATFTPADATDYTTAAASVPLTVNQATPRITWTPAALIAVGAPLSSPGQLDAMATAPGGTTELAGVFTYTPPAGTIFNTSGPQTLSVTFAPADAVDYTTATDNINMTASSFGVVAWGDSYTQGGQGLTDPGVYPNDLGKLITLPVANMGVDGNTSTQIGVREGGVPTYATVDSGTIPASGCVTVTFPTGYEPVTNEGPAEGVAGTILEVHGMVTYDSMNKIYTFTRTNSGSVVYAPGSPQFVVDTPYANYLPVFWEGRDNYLGGTQILSDLTSQVATVAPGQNYLVLSIINQERPVEFFGEYAYNQIVTDNTLLSNSFGTHYVDVWQPLIDSYDPTLITDVSDYNNHEVPTSLRPIVMNTTLANAIGSTDINLAFTKVCTSACEYGVGAVAIIDPGTSNAESVWVTATVIGNPVPVQRAIAGVLTSHAAGAPVTFIDPIHLNAQGYQIVANTVAQYLSAYSK
jgi:lysophospholipase L1-like esterase